MSTFNLSDQAIIRIFDLLQLALLTGTDIIDNLRTLRLTADGDILKIDDADNQAFIEAVSRLEARANEIAAEGMSNAGID